MEYFFTCTRIGFNVQKKNIPYLKAYLKTIIIIFLRCQINQNPAQVRNNDFFGLYDESIQGAWGRAFAGASKWRVHDVWGNERRLTNTMWSQSPGVRERTTGRNGPLSCIPLEWDFLWYFREKSKWKRRGKGRRKGGNAVNKGWGINSWKDRNEFRFFQR